MYTHSNISLQPKFKFHLPSSTFHSYKFYTSDTGRKEKCFLVIKKFPGEIDSVIFCSWIILVKCVQYILKFVWHFQSCLSTNNQTKLNQMWRWKNIYSNILHSLHKLGSDLQCFDFIWCLHKISIIFVLLSSKSLLTGNCKVSVKSCVRRSPEIIFNSD